MEVLIFIKMSTQLICTTNYHTFFILTHVLLGHFCGSGISAWLIWVLCLESHRLQYTQTHLYLQFIEHGARISSFINDIQTLLKAYAQLSACRSV